MNAVMDVVRLRNGVRLPFIDQGDPSGIPVVLLHGLTDSCRSFEPVLAELPASIRAIALTQRGHGDADRPAAGYRPEDFAEDVAKLLDELGIERAVIAGHSMGATVAQQVAIDHPTRTAGLVLLGSFARFAGNAAIAELWDLATTLSDPIAPEIAREFQEGTLARPVPPAYLELVIQESLKMPARVWKAALKGLLGSDGMLAAQRGGITAPTLLAWGELDAFVPRADQDALLAAIPAARLTVYEGGGHAFHWEDPACFAAEIATFVAATGR
jgi:pimeloyl-ACP methyl ester carboxylesterase